MADKVPTPVTGGGADKGKPDGVNTDPGQRGGGGESGGGDYPHPEAQGGVDGFTGHGGQSHNDYSGSGDKDDAGDANDNAATGTSG